MFANAAALPSLWTTHGGSCHFCAGAKIELRSAGIFALVGDGPERGKRMRSFDQFIRLLFLLLLMSFL